MSEFKFSRILFLIAILGLGLLVGFAIGNGKKIKPTELTKSYPHALSVYTAEGDTLLELDTRSECIKIWIGDSCDLDVWTLEENGWRRR